MTVQATEPLYSDVYVSSGVELDFPFPFSAFRDSDVGVAIRASGAVDWTPLDYGADYSVSRNPAPVIGGTVHLPAPLASGSQLIAYANIEFSQDRKFENQSGLFLFEIEASLDKLTAMAKLLADDAERAPRTDRFTGGRGLIMPEPSPGRVLIGRPDGAGWTDGPTDTEIANAETYANAAKDAAKRAESFAPFPDRAAAEAAHVPADVTIINVDGLQYRREPGATDLVTADGATWAQIDRKNALDATRAPLPTDDVSQGYAPGSRWLWQGQEWVAAGVAAGAARWVRKGYVTPQAFGAVGTGSADDTIPLQDTLLQAVAPRLADLGPGTFRVHRADPTGGGGTNPQDWALNPNAAEWIVGNGIDTVLRSQVPNNNIIMRYGLLPIGDREPDIVGGGIEGVTFDGGFDASDPATHPGWTDEGNMSLWASGVQDWTLRDVKSVNSPDYGIGFQNGRHKRMRIRDVFVDNVMNDAIDVKNNYGRGGDNSMSGVWASRFGRAVGAMPYAGIDFMAPRWVASHVWATDWGGTGDVRAAIRFKQGEAGESRGTGAYKAVLTGFHVEAEPGADTNPIQTVGVDVRHRRVLIGFGTIEGVGNSGVVVEQERATVVALDIQGNSATSNMAGLRFQNNGQTTDGHDAITSAIRVHDSIYGLYLSSDYGVHFGHSFKGVTRAVQSSGSYNVVLAQSRTKGGPQINDTGTGNWYGIWEQGVLNVYRQGAVRYSFGDFIEGRAPQGSVALRLRTEAGSGWLEAKAPTGLETGAWVFNTNGALSFQRDGTEVFRLTEHQVVAGVPVRLKKYSVTGLAGLTGVGDGAAVYCSNGDAGQPCLAVYDGTSWRRVSLGAAVSTT